ncbi:MAG: polysaccharide biosynthesis tyrosine autokinase [Hyphomonas sp.]|nr:polysaccharide biosynthesis tyrosine autokinase [Hyphomonas sp.]
MADPRYTKDPYEEEGGGFDFWGAVRTVMRRKFMIFAILVLGLSVAMLLALRVTPLYQATATIEIQREETRIIETGSVEPTMVADSEYMATQYALLKSRALAERVVETLDLAADENYADQDLGRELRVREAADTIAENLKVSPEGRSRVIKVSLVSSDPADAARVANTLVDSFIEGSLERKFNTTAYARKFLEERLATAKSALEEAERKLVDYAQQQDILEVSTNAGNTSLSVDALVALNQELAKAQSERISAEQRFRENLSNTTTREVLESDDLKRLRAARSLLAAEYQEKLGTFKPDYPDMLKLQARIDAIDDEIEAERGAILVSAEAAFKAAVAREESLSQRIDELKTDVQDQRGRKIDYTILQREVDTARTQYEALLQRLKEVSIAGGVGSSQASVVDRAVAPLLPFEPNIPRTLVQAFILSLFLGIGLAFALNYVDDTIKTPEDVKQKLGLPALGVIPKVRGRAANITEALKDPRSPITEAFFSARTALEFTTGDGPPKSLVVTSSRPSEGKTSTTISLGMSFAKTGRKVLIIDADMRKPSFVANAKDSIGLSGLLTQDVALTDQVVNSSTEGLYLIPSGVIPPNPAQLLSTPRLADLIAEAGEYFDIVIVDSPPLLGFADAPILGSVCDATVIVVESGTIRRPAALRTIERLFDSNSNVVGVMLMKFDAKKAGYESGDYYYSYGKGSYSYGAKQVSSAARNRRKIRLFAEPGPHQDPPGPM